MDSPSSQLHHELSAAASPPPPNPHRPLLTHLNADTSWLLQIPWPPGEQRERIYYNILIDPWFQGPQKDFGSWFSEQWHNTPTNIKTVRDVEDLIEKNEAAAAAAAAKEKDELGVEARNGATQPTTPQNHEANNTSPIDLIVISHEFRDHCHHDTLLEANKDIPVFAVNKAVKVISGWSHFTIIKQISPFTTSHPDWRTHSTPPLPPWLSISRLEPSFPDMISLHAALLITFSSSNPPLSSDSPATTTSTPITHAEALIYTPHGISPTDVSHLRTASPSLKTLALIHGLNDVKLGSQLNLGAHNGLKVVREVGARYWIRTHDEKKTAYGLVGRILRYTDVTFGDAIEREKEEKGKESGLEDLEGVRFEDLGVGERVVLE
ncbi:MAG: hypothetical protein M1812_003477 [Candelaria pacifica]|nr:MAG: hypothetical protein M1812_003477 [Candelaria pacifica]